MLRPVAVLLLCAAPSFAVKVNIANIAAATTIAINADTIVKAVRHPKRTAKDTGAKIKAAVKGH